MPIPQDLFFLVGWASCPSHQLMKRIFARGIMSVILLPTRSLPLNGVKGSASKLREESSEILRLAQNDRITMTSRGSKISSSACGLYT